MTRFGGLGGVLLAVVLATVLVPASSARAHAEVERLRRAVMDGDYEAARPGLDAALERNDLRLPDLVAVFELRAMLFHGLADEASLEVTLRALLAVDPEHRFGPRHPPDLERRSAVIRARAAPRLVIATHGVPSAVGVRLDAAIENDAEGLVRRLRYRVFDVSRGQWAEVEPPVEAVAGRELLVLVEAIGPGGAVIATAGSSDEPIRVTGPGASPGPESAGVATPLIDAPAEPGGGDEWVPWVVVAVVAVVLAGVGLGVGIYAADHPTITWQPSAPTETR